MVVEKVRWVCNLSMRASFLIMKLHRGVLHWWCCEASRQHVQLFFPLIYENIEWEICSRRSWLQGTSLFVCFIYFFCPFFCYVLFVVVFVVVIFVFVFVVVVFLLLLSSSSSSSSSSLLLLLLL